MQKTHLAMNVGRVALAVLLVLLWQWLGDTGAIDRFTASSPTAVADRMQQWFSSGDVWADLGATLSTLVCGYALGLVVGVAIGIAIGASPIARAYAEPFLVFFNALPRLILIPVFIVWFGFGMTPRVLTVFTVIVVMIIVTVAGATREINGTIIDNARMLGARRGQLIRTVYVPGVAIWIVMSARVAIGLAFQAAVVAEFFGSTSGLGFRMAEGLARFDASEMYAALLLTALLAWCVDIALARVQRYVGRAAPGGART